MVRRLFSWSADSFLVCRLVYSPQNCHSIHSLDSPLLTSLSTASICTLGLLLSISLVDHFHRRPHCRLPASAGLSSSLITSSTASIRWTYFVDIVVIGQRQLGFLLVDLVVDGQRLLDFALSTLSSTASVCWTLFGQPCCQRPASAGLSSSTSSLTASVRWTFFVKFTVDGQRPLDLP